MEWSSIVEIYPTWLVVTAAVFVVAWLVQLILWLVVWWRPWWTARRQRREAQRATADAQSDLHVASGAGGVGRLSVIVYAHNQSEELLRNVPLYFGQDYGDYEVIIVDDGSTDDTLDVLLALEQRYERLTHTAIASDVRIISHRKLAMTLGVKAARGEVVVMTSADCAPSSPAWLSTLARRYADSRVAIVLGPVAYERRSGHAARFYGYDLFARLHTLFALTLALRPYAGWATNLSFRRTLFFAERNRGLADNLVLQPGEDDLFVAAMAGRGNTAVACSADALVVHQATPLGYMWSSERLNRAFTSMSYAVGPRVMRGLDIASRYLTVVGGLVLLVVFVLAIAVPFDYGNLVAAFDGRVSASANVVAPWAFADEWQNWLPAAVVLALLLLRVLWVWLVSRAVARAIGVRRYWYATFAYELFTPLVDVWFRLRALMLRSSFYVGTIRG